MMFKTVGEVGIKRESSLLRDNFFGMKMCFLDVDFQWSVRSIVAKD